MSPAESKIAAPITRLLLDVFFGVTGTEPELVPVPKPELVPEPAPFLVSEVSVLSPGAELIKAMISYAHACGN